MDSKQSSSKDKDAAVAVSSPRLRPVVLLKTLAKSYEGCLQESSDSSDFRHAPVLFVVSLSTQLIMVWY
uniref:Uncharacterized protein n=1 Tax=Helianthus annuus TaxID=4232 RepID=A0A251RPZ8_HELAN